MKSVIMKCRHLNLSLAKEEMNSRNQKVRNIVKNKTNQPERLQITNMLGLEQNYDIIKYSKSDNSHPRIGTTDFCRRTGSLR